MKKVALAVLVAGLVFLVVVSSASPEGAEAVSASRHRVLQLASPVSERSIGAQSARPVAHRSRSAYVSHQTPSRPQSGSAPGSRPWIGISTFPSATRAGSVSTAPACSGSRRWRAVRTDTPLELYGSTSALAAAGSTTPRV